MRIKFLSIFAACAALTAAAGTFNYEGIWFETLDNGTCKVAGDNNIARVEVIDHGDWTESKFIDAVGNQIWPNSMNNYNGELDIPEVAVDPDGKAYDVVEIGQFAFMGKGLSGKLTIPASIRKIGDYAFYNCNNINNIVIRGGLDGMGSNVFSSSGMNNLRLTIGGAVKTIPAGALSCLAGEVQYLTVEGTVSAIGDNAFAGFNKIRELNLEEGIKTIGNSAFALESDNSEFSGAINIPNSVTRIGDAAFKNWNKATAINLGDHVQYIGDDAFYKCENVHKIIIPDSVTWIGDRAFYDNHIDAADALHIGAGVTHIGAEAFRSLKGHFYDFTLPAGLEFIGKDAFNVQDNRGTMANLYVYAPYPPQDVDREAFGALHENPDDLAAGWLIYRTVCLHVPLGKGKLYREDPVWGQFQCIIDDIVEAEVPGSISDMIDYVFLVPGESIDLLECLEIDGKLDSGYDSSVKETIEWVIAKGDGDVIEFADKSAMHALTFANGSQYSVNASAKVNGVSFGQAIVKGYRTNVTKMNANGQAEVLPPSIAATVIVFVCPTVTVVYNDEDVLADEAARAPRHLKGTTAGETEVEAEMGLNRFTTYEHRVVYNSLPLLQVQSSHFVSIEKIERVEYGPEGELESDTELIFDTNGVVGGQADHFADSHVTNEDVQYIVPTDPITNNRVLEIYTVMPLNGNPLSGAEEVGLGSDLSIAVAGNMISVKGAADADVVAVFNSAGQMVSKSTAKTIQINQAGVYVVTVRDEAFKVYVK